MSLIRSSPDLSHKISNLRATAALLVVFFHYAIFFFTNQDFCAKLSYFSPLDLSSFDGFIQILKDFPLNLGCFAVTIFFLISGFLTPYLLERYTTRRMFLKNRFFRLWPTYAICLAINIFFIWGACIYNDIDFPFTSPEIFASFLGVRDIFGHPFITGVVWTFEIEIKFVLFCFIVYPLIQRASLYLLTFIIISLFWICFFGKFLTEEYLELPDLLFYFFRSMTHNLKFFCFLLEGMAYYFFLEKKVSRKNFLYLSLILMISFVSDLYFTIKIDFFITYILSYFSAFAFFVWYILRIFSNSQSFRFLRFVSDMSYPLYLIHAIPSYIIMYILYDFGVSLFWGMGIAFVMCFPLSYGVHRFIESPIRNKFSR